MVTGENGVSGALVQRRANKENNQEHVNVIHQLPNMEERNVMASQKIQEFVTRKYYVQVIITVAQLLIEVENYSKDTQTFVYEKNPNWIITGKNAQKC